MLFLMLAPLAGMVFERNESWLTQLSAAALLFCFGAYLTAYAFRTTITLADEAIELRTVLGQKSLRFDVIQGRREYLVYGKYGARRNWKLEPNNPNPRILD